ncbi:MAG: C-type lectin domain-containing protein [Clostridia bacterium]|nr:C-type lectin domain-containing protein [Clostridia bacterium]
MKMIVKESTKHLSKWLIAALLLCLFTSCLPFFALAETADEAALEEQYQAAMALYEAKEYQAAAEAFEALGDYSNSPAMVRDSLRHQKREDYRAACKLYDEGKYYEAREALKVLGDYERSKHYLYQCELKILGIEYRQAKDLFEAGDYAAAQELFLSLNGYSDSKEQAAKAEACLLAEQQAALELEWYNKGVAFMEEKNYAAARDAFIEAGPCQDATDRMYEAILLVGHEEINKAAKKALEEGEYARAVMLFELNGDYEDSAAQADAAKEAWRNAGGDPEAALSADEQNALDFERALMLKKLWRVEESNEILLALGEYNNAAQLVAKVTEMKFTAEQLRDDATTQKSAVFVAPDGSKHCYRMYRGVKYWVEARAFCEALGGHMATLTTPEENQFVHDFMVENGFTTAYFGLMDEERDRTWVWVTGEPVEYTNWDSLEPSYSARERYGMYFYKHIQGTWNDSHFYEHWDDQEWSYFCEWDLDDDGSVE